MRVIIRTGMSSSPHYNILQKYINACIVSALYMTYIISIIILNKQ